MNVRFCSVLALALFALFNQANAQIYKYVDPVTGAVEYTNQPRKGAKSMNLDGTLSEIPTGNNARTVGGSKPKDARAVNVSSGVNNNAGKSDAAVDASVQKTRDGTRSRILADELAIEEKSLAELRVQMNNGKPLPMADETVGSAKYIDRVKQLEKSQRHHERNIAALKKEIELARL
jgi:hypothetical protein